SSPSGDGNQAVEVAINTTVPLFLSQVIKAGATLPVGTQSFAELKSNTPGCVIALSQSGTGVSLSSASGITADACAVDSNSTVSVPCSTTITTIMVGYDSASAPSQGCGGIQAPSGESVTTKKTLTADPFANNSEVTAAVARVPSVAALTSPTGPSVASGGNVSFGPTAGSTASQLAADGCSGSVSGSNWTVTCPTGGTVHLGAVSVSSTAHVTFNTSSNTTYDFSGGLSVVSSASATFGPGTFNIAQGITVSSASSASFGAGTFDIGPSTSGCSDGGKYSLCVESSTSLVFGGPSAFTLAGGVYAGSSATVVLGSSGSTNSFDIGTSSNGNAVETSSSSTLVMGDAGANPFELVGNVTAASSACVTFGDASEHDINGALVTNSASNTTLGAGIYTIDDYVQYNSASGGSGCSGYSAGLGSGVTFVLGGAATGTGSCAGMVFCVLSASSGVLVAPTSGATAGFAVIGPTSSSNTAGALFESAASGAFAGVFYLPNGPITINSASGLGNGSGQCLELIGSEVTASSASALASTCSGLGQTSGASVMLVE
ncbi:MAG: hypothetical protein ACRED8_09660, partial [Caulobacteraceae bacterium]